MAFLLSTLMQKSMWIAFVGAALASAYWLISEPFDETMLQGKSVLITGASYGIGKEIAMYYCAHGAKVVVVSRSADKLAAVVDECQQRGSENVFFVAADLSTQDEEKFKSIVDNATAMLGGSLDTLVLNHVSSTGNVVPEGWTNRRDMKLMRGLFDTNAFSYMHLTFQALDHLNKSPGGGKIIVVSSAAGVGSFSQLAGYSASKHALHGFFNSLRHDIWRSNSSISITMCILGAVDTEAYRSSKKFRESDIAGAPVEETAKKIAIAGELRRRDLFYPLLQTYPAQLLNAIAPSLLDRLVSYLKV